MRARSENRQTFSARAKRATKSESSWQSCFDDGFLFSSISLEYSLALLCSQSVVCNRGEGKRQGEGGGKGGGERGRGELLLRRTRHAGPREKVPRGCYCRLFTGFQNTVVKFRNSMIKINDIYKNCN